MCVLKRQRDATNPIVKLADSRLVRSQRRPGPAFAADWRHETEKQKLF